jgi:ketosteroid isomerase-like protein
VCGELAISPWALLEGPLKIIGNTMTYSEIEKEIDRVEQDLADAVTHQDAISLNHIIADDFLIVGESLADKLGDKKLYIGDCLASGPIEDGSASYDRLKLRVYGETAIVNSVFKSQVTIEGKDYGGAFLATRVWVKNGEQWQLVMVHSHRLEEKRV